ncbi:large conductance mechanosensitive channel protein MscL [Neisseria sp. ZJ106]|uniref:Large-conductance mechanosensitive channel n=1 Tax=Neisseria lisongii TaxID=2912188 RepID=A0AAW5AD77_9NEIS|nr:large conductance mechanosensitive channel protein MscL [Neisseria lisongii]MCF7520592.1 large conductance mechanosensitive channel protein MscL [Neisseria lisongii]MCF7529005.1 large conductance mechanosensitive channel protein MscL [Neisseria lisongii]WCL71472.1 large conductance mechanosensitive channel protein MscL [Neisseria lisongii]
MSIASEFKEFIMRGNVIDLAVGMVVGTAFSGIVKSLVDDVIMPPIGILIGGVDFSNLFITLKDGATVPEGGYATLAAAQQAGAVTLNIGLFINTVISFLIIAAAIFCVVKLLNSMKKKQEVADAAEEAAAEPSEEVLLLREIRDSLSKK